ncbi:MAG TPA: ABC transporter permease [Xanthobacteraceae bacterium]|jgi:NitT/TauT family transport system permease protein
MVEAPAPSLAARTPHRLAAQVARLTPALSLLCCLAVWEAAVRYFQVPVYLVPAPSLIAGKLIAGYPLFLQETLHSVAAIITGFALAAVVGVPAAALMIYSAWFRRSVYPILLTAQVLPKVALAPLFIVWFGFGLLPKVLMTFLISFFPIVIDTLTGLNAVRPESLLLIRSMGGSRWQAFRKVRLPSALPSIFGGFKVAITFAVVGTIVAEFVGSDNGLGYILVLARGNLDTVTVFAAILWLIAIGFLFYFAVELAERFCLRGRAAYRRRELGAGL